MTAPTDLAAGVPGRPARTGATTPAPVRRRRRRFQLTPWLFLLVPLTILIVLTYLPVLNMFYLGFVRWDGLSPLKTWVGWRNYRQLFTRPELFQVFFVSLYYLGASVIQMGLALYFATILSFKTRFGNLFKGLLFFPNLINGVAIGFTFLYFFRPGGTLDTLLSFVGVQNTHLWLGDPKIVNYSLAGVSVWRYMGLNFVLFLGAIQSISPDLYEASEIDGANRWHQFRYIILPGIKPVVGLMSILAISGSLSVFETPYIMTGGANGSSTFVIQTVQLAFSHSKYGLASASAVFLLFVVLLVTWIQRKLVPDERVDLV